MLGPIVDSSALAVGSLLGAALGKYLPKRVKESLPLIFGVITISLGATLVGQADHLHMVVLALIVGTFLGELCYMERGLEIAVRKTVEWSHRKNKTVDDNFILQYITLISAFCFGSMGMFGAINEGITGSPEILLIKSVLDLFSGLIFGSILGVRVGFIALPQFGVLIGLYFSAGLITSLVTDSMLNDFSSCGGIIFLATGLRLCGIKIFPIINMMPGLFLVLPFSYWWATYISHLL